MLHFRILRAFWRILTAKTLRSLCRVVKKDLRLIGREFDKHLKELYERIKRWENLSFMSLEVKGKSERQEVDRCIVETLEHINKKNTLKNAFLRN